MRGRAGELVGSLLKLLLAVFARGWSLRLKLKLEKAPKWEKARGAPELREAPLARTGCSGHAPRHTKC